MNEETRNVGDCFPATFSLTYCSTHNSRWPLSSIPMQCDFVQRPVYKVVIRERAAFDMINNDFFGMGFDSIELAEARISPIVFYARFTDAQALEYAQQENFEVTRARADWSI